MILEMGTLADGYWADHTRTVVAGAATLDQRRALEAFREAVRACFAAARAGASASEADAAARERCLACGFEQFPHHTGHGVGFRYHEAWPALVPGSDDVLVTGMATAAEPGVYACGLGGVRWEDEAVVGPDGARAMAISDYEAD